jgi:hypothetical protein
MMKNKQFHLKFPTFILLLASIYAAYYLLLRENRMHSSISSIVSYANHFAIRPHLLILGLLPIYIATMIFGAAMLGIYLGARIEILLNPLSKK